MAPTGIELEDSRIPYPECSGWWHGCQGPLTHILAAFPQNAGGDEVPKELKSLYFGDPEMEVTAGVLPLGFVGGERMCARLYLERIYDRSGFITEGFITGQSVQIHSASESANGVWIYKAGAKDGLETWNRKNSEQEGNYNLKRIEKQLEELENGMQCFFLKWSILLSRGQRGGCHHLFLIGSHSTNGFSTIPN